MWAFHSFFFFFLRSLDWLSSRLQWWLSPERVSVPAADLTTTAKNEKNYKLIYKCFYARDFTSLSANKSRSITIHIIFLSLFCVYLPLRHELWTNRKWVESGLSRTARTQHGRVKVVYLADVSLLLCCCWISQQLAMLESTQASNGRLARFSDEIANEFSHSMFRLYIDRVSHEFIKIISTSFSHFPSNEEPSATCLARGLLIWLARDHHRISPSPSHMCSGKNPKKKIK